MAARNNGYRHMTVQDRSRSELLFSAEALPQDADGWDAVDERLKLLFVCAHPAIEAGMRTPLMLQVVLGLSAERIASAFLVAT